jgi:hypothetical protein
MENLLKLFQEGKNFEDFKRVEDTEYKDVFDTFTFKATIPLYDLVSENNRYASIPFDFVAGFLMFVYKLYKKNIRRNNYNDVKLVFERFKNRVYPSNITKELTLEIFINENQRYATGVFIFVGKQRNLHLENCKFFAAVFGLLGVRVTDFIYSSKDYFCRFDLIETDLLFREDLAKKERIKLLNENVNFITNYNQLLEDKEKHLWMKLAVDNDIYISFKNQIAFNRWIKSIEEQLRKFGEKEKLLGKILQFFEKLHWIRIENIHNLSFQIERVIEENKEQRQFLLDYLSKNSNLSESEGNYYLR